MNTLVEKLLQEKNAHPKTRLRRKWGQFVAGWPWEWFATFTFAYNTHPERALKLFRVWRSMLSREIYGRRWYKRHPYGVRSVIAIEYHKSGQIHLHALLAGVGDIRRLTWMDKWQTLDELAGFPRIYPVRNNGAVSNYVTKYVTKGGDVYLSKNLRLESRNVFDTEPSPESDA